MIILSSCGSSRNVKQDFFKFPIDYDIKVQYEGSEYLIGLKISSENNILLTFKSPETLKNMQLSFEDGKTYLTYHGITIPIEGDYAKDNGILLLRNIFLSDKSTFDSAKIVKISGVKYCRQRYVSDRSVIDIFFVQGSDDPSFIEGNINGRTIKVIFVNE